MASTTLTLSETAADRLAALTKGFGWASDQVTVESLIKTFHQAYESDDPPDGWAFNPDLTLADLERYFEAYDAEKPGNAWHERGRSLRAAAASGWFVTPEAVTQETIAGLSPRDAVKLKKALDAHYTRLTVADPNSSGPSPNI